MRFGVKNVNFVKECREKLHFRLFTNYRRININENISIVRRTFLSINHKTYKKFHLDTRFYPHRRTYARSSYIERDDVNTIQDSILSFRIPLKRQISLTMKRFTNSNWKTRLSSRPRINTIFIFTWHLTF